MLVEAHRPSRRVLESAMGALRIRRPIWHVDTVEAFETIKHDSPDLLILGQGLSSYDSLNLIAWIREDPDRDYAYLPIIFMSTNGSALAREALNRGVHRVLPKPVSPDSLQSTISSVIQRPPPFIKAGSYFGPDRRWQNGNHNGTDRRKAGDDIIEDSAGNTSGAG